MLYFTIALLACRHDDFLEDRDAEVDTADTSQQDHVEEDPCTYKHQSNTLTPSADTYVFEEDGTGNYNTKEFLRIGVTGPGNSPGMRLRTLLSFDTSDFDRGTIDEAVLSFTTISGTCQSSINNTWCNYDLTVEVYEVKETWEKDNVHWQNAPETYKEIFSTTVINQGFETTGEYSIDITNLAQLWADNETNNGLMLQADESDLLDSEGYITTQVDTFFASQEHETYDGPTLYVSGNICERE
jgi:hypothetical protein